MRGGGGGGGQKEEKQTQKKKTASHPMAAIYPAPNQQNLDTQLTTAKLLLAIHSARNSADLEAKTIHINIDCLTVKRDSLRKHVQPQIYKITDQWVHGDLQCRPSWSTICFFLHDSSKPMCAIDEKQRNKRHGLIQVWEEGFLPSKLTV